MSTSPWWLPGDPRSPLSQDLLVVPEGGRSNGVTALGQEELRASLQHLERSSSKWDWGEKFRLKEPDNKITGIGKDGF